ncbi:MAG: type II secretion system F family protein [Acidobacteria bacterium]|nr:type II secretion system F family protein [Acidobacteriota bacterium]
MTLILPLLAFATVSLLVAAGALALSPGRAAIVRRRLGEVTGRPVKTGADAVTYERVVTALKHIGSAVPKSPSEMTKLQLRLVHAGFRRHDAVPLFFGIRAGCALLLFAVVATPIFMRPSISMALGAAGLGWVLPAVVLARLARRRQHRVRLSIPDALDLLVVSVEAGLGLDQAIQRVGEELAPVHPELSDDLRLINLELRAGKARPEALHNLAARTGVDDLTSLVAVLVQTDKFGTSVTQALRVHSDVLRTKRRQRAEEAAAKTGVKMVFPLVICIFPAIWIVTVGPAAIKIMDVLGRMADR